MKFSYLIRYYLAIRFAFAELSGQLPKRGELVWSDEFDYNGLPNDNEWDYHLGNVSKEQQFYTNNNARVQNGHLYIVSKMERHGLHNYTSTRLQSKRSFRYGVFEARIKIPRGQGLWPAFWLRYAESPYKWPHNGEIDIFEHFGNKPGYAASAIHCSMFNSRKRNDFQKKKTKYVENMFNKYHVYALDWNASRIKFYLNGEEFYEYKKLNNSLDSWPFDNNFKIVLNLAVSKKYANNKQIDDSVFPAKLYVDYVRHYMNVDAMNKTNF